MPKWIDATEELPQDYLLEDGDVREYVVMIQDATIPTCLYYDGADFYSEDGFERKQSYKVAHWQPLPEPPHVPKASQENLPTEMGEILAENERLKMEMLDCGLEESIKISRAVSVLGCLLDGGINDSRAEEVVSVAVDLLKGRV